MNIVPRVVDRLYDLGSFLHGDGERDMGFITPSGFWIKNVIRDHAFAIIRNLCVRHNIQFHDDLASQQVPRTIWSLWEQGAESAPEIVRACIASVQRCNPGLQQILLTDKSLDNFVSVPPHIIEKYHAGKIDRRHYSDIIRALLLCHHGGIWLDATIYARRAIPENVFGDHFTSMTCASLPNEWSASDRYFMAFMLASPMASGITRFTCDVLSAYWQEYDYLYNYLLIDFCLLYYLREHPRYAQLTLSNAIPGDTRYLLNDTIRKGNIEHISDIIARDNSVFYKMNHKCDYSKLDGARKSMYQKVLGGTIF